MPTENHTPDTSDRSEIAALKSQVFMLLTALVVISGTLTVYLYRQSDLAGKDLGQVQKAITHNEQAVQGFVAQLQAYGEKHPDFQPLLKKYGIPPKPAATSVAPVAPIKK